MKTLSQRLRRVATELRADTSAVAILEFALVLPVFAMMTVGGLELANYVTTKMRVSQAALHVADHIARIGDGSLQTQKTFTERQINDVLTGAGLQTGSLGLYTRGRVIISSLDTDTNNSGKFKIAWQRCRGAKVHSSNYGNSGQGNLNGIGPAGRQVTAPPDGQTIFVEIAYDYRPLINTRFAPVSTTFSEIATMPVRDRRDASPQLNSGTASSCTVYSAT